MVLLEAFVRVPPIMVDLDKARSALAWPRQLCNDAFDTNVAPIPAFAKFRSQRQARVAGSPEKSGNEKCQQPAHERKPSRNECLVLAKLPASQRWQETDQAIYQWRQLRLVLQPADAERGRQRQQEQVHGLIYYGDNPIHRQCISVCRRYAGTDRVNE